MNRIALRLLAAFTLLSFLFVPSACDPGPRSEGLLIEGVHIVDVVNKRILRSQDILIVDGRIAEIGETGALDAHPESRTNLAGTYVVPGLYDAHVHIDTTGRLALMLPDIANLTISSENIDDDIAPYLAFGVTGIVVFSGSPDILATRERAKEPGAFLPRMVVASPILDGPAAKNPIHKKVANAAEGIAAVNEAGRLGYDFIKVYNDLDLATRSAIIRRAGELGLPVAGHLPPAMTLEQAIVPGFSNVAHAEEITRTLKENEDAHFRKAVNLMVGHKVSLTPNLIAYREITGEIRNIDAHLSAKNMSLVPPLARMYSTPPFNGYVADFGGDEIRDRAIAHFTRIAASMDRLVRRAHEAGVLLLAGSDTGNPTMFPGQSLHDELHLLRQAGLDPYEALASATINVAKFLGEDGNRGSVQEGKIADLAFFDVDPIAQPDNVGRASLVAVMREGMLFDKRHLDRESKRLTKSFAEREKTHSALAKASPPKSGQ